MELNKIYQGDCLELMKELPDKSVDLVLTDPPYGIGASQYSRGGSQYGNSKTKCRIYENDKWDCKKLDISYFKEIFRISKNQIIFGGNYYGSILGDTSCYIVWDKDNGNNGYADCELAWTSFNTAVRKFKFKWHGMLQEDMKNKEIRFHPTQKPVKLFEWILNKYSKESNTILDPFLGSGTTAIACINQNRNFIGIEKEPKYFDIANKRIKEAQAQIRLAI